MPRQDAYERQMAKSIYAFYCEWSYAEMLCSYSRDVRDLSRSNC